MVDSQERLTMAAGDEVSRMTGILVIAAVVALVALKRLSIKVNL